MNGNSESRVDPGPYSYRDEVKLNRIEIPEVQRRVDLNSRHLKQDIRVLGDLSQG